MRQVVGSIMIFDIDATISPTQSNPASHSKRFRQCGLLAKIVPALPEEQTSPYVGLATTQDISPCDINK
jgi:hypothetical protein